MFDWKTALAAVAGIIVGIIAALFLLMLVTASTARATWKPEYAAQAQSVRDWYENAELTKPAQQRLGFVGCCEHSDVVKTKFKVEHNSGVDEWWYFKDEHYERVPDDIIHWGESGPGGEAVLFALSHDVLGQPAGTLTCFYPPQGGL